MRRAIMILTKLHLENFKRYSDYTIEFAEGLVGIIGKNGSGKSTLFEAILFALYGEFKSRGAKELVRNADASTKDAVVVSLSFEFDTDEYRVVREFRGKVLTANAKLYKNKALTTSGAREVTSAIVSLTKMSKDAFMHTLFASQKELTTLSSLKNEDRKRMIRRLLGLEKIDFIERELIEKSRELKRTISAFDEVLLGEEELSEKEAQLKEIKRLQKEVLKEQRVKSKEMEILKEKERVLKEELKAFTQAQESKRRAQSEIELLKNTLNAEQESLLKIDTQLQELEKKAKELQKLLSVKEEYKELNDALKVHEQNREKALKKEGLQKEQTELREQYKKAKSDRELLSKECALYDTLIEQEQSLQQSTQGLKALLQQSIAKERELNARVSAERRIISDTDAKIQNIQNLGASSACPTCTRPLLEEYENVLNILHTTIDEVQKGKVQKLENQIATLLTQLQLEQANSEKEEKKLQIVSKQIALIESKQKDLSKATEYFEAVKERGMSNKEELSKLAELLYEPNRHKELQEQLSRVKKEYEYVLTLETELKRHAMLTQEYQELTQRVTKSREVLREKESALELIKYDKVLHTTKEKEFDSLEKIKDEQLTALHNTNLNLAKYEGETRVIETTLSNNTLQLKKVQEKKYERRDYEKIKLSLVDFKTKLNAKVAPRISDTASKMYAQITKGKYQHIEVSNDFDFFIYDDGKRYPIERFSGGEIDLANLVLRIAISRTLTELSGANSIGFLAFDEIFGSQDEARRMEILEAFHTIKEQYRQIFLISHEMEIKEMFERLIEL